MRALTIGTRGSALARWQAEHVAERLRGVRPGLQVELRIIMTNSSILRKVPLLRARL